MEVGCLWCSLSLSVLMRKFSADFAEYMRGRYNNTCMSVMASQITGKQLFVQQFVQATNTETPKVLITGESISDQRIPLTKGQQCGKRFHGMTS